MSHTKRSFIQHVIARLCPKRDDRERALTYAEELWAWLTAKGYGAPEPAGPRQSTDWYAKLSAPDRARFDRFWHAYGYKTDRNGAAMRWHQLGDLTDAEAERIIEAAKIANKNWRDTAQPGQARKMAQGWLFERRWEDHPPDGGESRAATDDGTAILRGLRQKLGTLQRLNALRPTGELRAQIDELVTAIGNFQRPQR